MMYKTDHITQHSSAKPNEDRVLLGVNIDHVATLRQARHTSYPDPVDAAIAAEAGGADGITLHLREDRRHIQERDVWKIKEVLSTRMNLEMAVTEPMLALAEQIKPTYCCLVPERREELTTEGGLNVLADIPKIKAACQRLREAGIAVSLFIDPDAAQIEAAKACHADLVELHTGHYALAKLPDVQQNAWQRIVDAVELATTLGFTVNAGHGLHYQNVQKIAKIKSIYELNIGHSIVSYALFCGLTEAVRKMRNALNEARKL